MELYISTIARQSDQSADMIIGIDTTVPGSKARKYDADELFDAYRVPCSTRNVCVHVYQVLVKNDDAAIEVSFLAA